MALPIRLVGDPVLRQRCVEVTDIDGALARLAGQMVDAMYAAPGVGVAASQVGVLKRMFVYDIGNGPITVINPVIVDSDGEFAYEEGCLSVPDLHFEIVRPNRVHLQGYDLDGNLIDIEGEELLGRVFQHELDHLDGVLLLDRLDPDVRRQAMRELRRRAEAEAGAR
jgi:peptide deformylase